VVETVLAIHPDDTYDVLAINAASLSTQLSGLPFSGPIGGTRIALVGDQWVAFPRYSELERAVFSMVVAGRVVTGADGSEDVAVMMVEAEATDNAWNLIQEGATAPTEDVVAQGLEAAKPFILALCKAQAELAEKAAKPVTELPRFLDYTTEEYEAVVGHAAADLAEAIAIAGKHEREDRLDEVKKATLEALAEQFPDSEKNLSAAFRAATKHFVRQRVLKDGVRMDGRGLRDIRTLSAEVDVLPRVHGSALFERGETQIMGVTTLNMLRMEQQLDTLSPVTRKRYMHNYNF